MPPRRSASPPLSDGPAARSWLLPVSALMLLAAGFAAYSDSLHGPFIYDDLGSILENPSIRRLWPLSGPLSPPHGHGWTVEGRPLLNLSLAINYALGGSDVVGYHLLNLLIHLSAALALFGLVRRTLAGAAGFAPVRAGLVALAVALLWLLQPLQTEAVTYTVQRAESLMGLCFLLTLYAFARYAQTSRRGWAVVSVICCLLGMGAKEVMAMAPVVVWLYDRTFWSGSLLAALNRRRGYYAALALTWIPLAILVLAGGGNRSGSAGFGSGITWGAYELTQFEAVIRYLALSFWPHPLAFDYGPLLRSPGEAAPFALGVVLLLGGTVWALLQPPGAPGRLGWRAAGFAGTCFFLILAVTALIPGGSEMIVERRMYVPLAAVLAAAVLALEARFGPRALLFGFAAAAGFGVMTWRRNLDYRSDEAIWADSLAKFPRNSRAEYNLGVAYFNRGDAANEAAHYELALQLDPNNAAARHSLANARFHLGRTADALAEFAAALALKPDDPVLHSDFGTVLLQTGDLAGAETQFRAAIRLQPDYPPAHDNLGTVLARTGRIPEAVGEFRTAVAETPDSVGAQFNLAVGLSELGQLADALPHYAKAARAEPDNPAIQRNFGLALLQAGRPGEAIPHFEAVLRQHPEDNDTRQNLAVAQAAAAK